MKPLGSLLSSLIWCLLGFLPVATQGSEGVVLNERVNVRTRPSIASEVIHQLSTGNKVTILEKINLDEPQPNEPKEWYRIIIPEGTELWVSSQYLDASDNSIDASRLNVRAGPGQNFSVVGRLDRGTVVEPLRVSAGWTAIKPLENTVAFVATEFVNVPSTEQASEILEPEVPETTNAPEPTTETPPTETPNSVPEVIVAGAPESAQSPSPTQEQPPIVPVAPVENPTVQTEPDQSPKESLFDKIEQAAPAQATPPPTNPETNPEFITSPEPITTEEIVIEEPAETDIEPLELSEAVAEHLKRVITRDGIVRKSRSIQSPTYHRLDDPRTGTTINYLYTGKLQVDLGTGPRALKPYEGRKIRVMGVEAVDARWPSIPVIEVEKLRILE